MPRSNPPWAQSGMAAKARDVDFSSAGGRVSEEAQARTVEVASPRTTTTPTVVETAAARLFEFSNQLSVTSDRLPARPNTSAGPASRSKSPRGNETDAWETKDDLHLKPLAVHGKPTTFYNFPLPGSLPTLDNSTGPTPPRRENEDSPSPPPSTLEALVLPTAIPATMDVFQMEIGMALGSPAHPPPTWQEEQAAREKAREQEQEQEQERQSVQASVEAYSRHLSPDPTDSGMEGSSHSPPPAKQKSKGWGKKMFGGLFGSQKKQQAPFYQVQPDLAYNVSTGTALEVPHRREESGPSEKKVRGRGRSLSEKRAKKTQLQGNNPMPLDGLRSAKTPVPATQIKIHRGPSSDGRSRSNSSAAGLLNVDIPSVQMDRYSVMFSSVLQKPANTSSSLLARRQATLDKLKTVNAELAEKEKEIEAKSRMLMPRRATSPVLTRHEIPRTASPAFSLFPHTPSRTPRDSSPGPGSRQSNRDSSAHRHSSSLQRSNTSPAALSPSRPTFAPGLNNEAHAILLSQSPSSVDSETKSTSPITKFIKEGAKAKLNAWSPSKSHLTLDGSSEDDSASDIEKVVADAHPLKPKLPEPHWAMITPSHAPAASLSGSSSAGSDSSNSTAASSVSGALGAQSLKVKSVVTHQMPKSSRSNSPAPSMRGARQEEKLQRPLGTQERTTERVVTTVKVTPGGLLGRDTASGVSPARILNREVSPVKLGLRDASPARPGVIRRQTESEALPARRHGREGSPPRKISGEESPLRRPRSPADEAHIQSAADVSIARQISVSRQQRQMLVPIRRGQSLRVKVVGAANFPTPTNGLGPANFHSAVISNGGVASPLTAVAVAAKEEHERTSPLEKNGTLLSQEREERKGSKERLVEAVKPNTPKLVVVGHGVDEREKKWAGATATLVQPPLRNSASEGRTLSNGRGVAAHAHSPAVEEVRIGLTVRGNSPTRPAQYRNSERVIVEQIGGIS